MKEVLKFDIESSGILSAVPYLFFWLFQLSAGFIADFMMKKFKLSVKTVRRIFNALGFFVPMFCVIGLMFVTCSYKYVAVFILTIAFAFM